MCTHTYLYGHTCLRVCISHDVDTFKARVGCQLSSWPLYLVYWHRIFHLNLGPLDLSNLAGHLAGVPAFYVLGLQLALTWVLGSELWSPDLCGKCFDSQAISLCHVISTIFETEIHIAQPNLELLMLLPPSSMLGEWAWAPTLIKSMCFNVFLLKSIHRET